MKKRTATAQAYVARAKGTTRALLKRHRITYTACGHIIGVAPATVGRWLDDDYPGFFDLGHAVAICCYLNLPLSAFFPHSDWVDNRPTPRDHLMALTDDEITWLLAVRAGALKCYE